MGHDFSRLTTGPGLYVHLPYCRAKCGYCDFFSLAEKPPASYLDALLTEATRLARTEAGAVFPRPFRTLYLGGGTPTLFPAKKLAGLTRQLADFFAAGGFAEATIETNPGMPAAEELVSLKEAGISRLSIGVQSFDDRLLAKVGRIHSGKDAGPTVDAARRAGFHSISLDLICGLPGQNAEGFRHDLEQALALQPEHLSIYDLTVEKNTPLARRLNSGELILPDEAELSAMEESLLELTGAAGLVRYEISNWSLPGHESRHNNNYWENGLYLGLGAGAVSFDGRDRWHNSSAPKQYMAAVAAGERQAIARETLDPSARFRETVVMGLRMVKGVDEQKLFCRFGRTLDDEYGTLLEQLAGQDLVVRQDGFFRLTGHGMRFANQVMVRLV